MEYYLHATALAGNALVWEEVAIHAALFALDEEEEIDPVDHLRHRRGFQVNG